MTKFKLTYEPDYDPPETWEEVKALERPAKIRAARVFLRKAAVKLCDDAGLHPDDIVMLFNAVPEWINHQRHVWKRSQEKPWAWRCNECGHQGHKMEFFQKGKEHAVCPECFRMNAQEMVGVLMPPPAEEDSQAEPGDVKASFCATDGHPCPVCEALGRKDIIIESHSCIVCETLYCPTCHGIVTAGSSRAFDSCARCKC